VSTNLSRKSLIIYFASLLADVRYVKVFNIVYICLKKYSLIFFIVSAGLFSSFQSQSAYAYLVIHDYIVAACISLIFFFQGVSLSKREFMDSYKPIKLPIFVLFFNFIGIPLLVLFCFVPFVDDSLKMGFSFLSFLPATIALSVSYTDMAGGRVETALFSTCVSNLLGAFYVPFIFILFWDHNTLSLPEILGVLENVFSLIILPVILGYLFRQRFEYLGKSFLRYKKLFVETLLTIIIYDSFLVCFESSNNELIGLSYFLTVVCISLTLFMVVSLLIWFTSRYLNVDQPSRVAVFYTASQKSLCTGIPLMVLTLSALGESELVGILLLPLIFYYLFQTVFGGLLTYKFKALSEIN